MFAAMQHDMNQTVISVAVDAPQHSGLTGALDYLADQPWPPGTLLRVPLGKRELLGIVWHAATRHHPKCGWMPIWAPSRSGAGCAWCPSITI